MTLTQELLDRLDAQWARLRPDWHTDLQPGLGDDEQDQLVEPLGLSIPPELRMWWGWRTHRHRMLATQDIQLFRLKDAVEHTLMHREVAEDVADLPAIGPEWHWPRRLLSVADWQPYTIAADCDVHAASVPLFAHDDILTDDSHTRLLLPSFGALINGIVEMYEADLYAWDEGRGTWISQGTAAPYCNTQANPI